MKLNAAQERWLKGAIRDAYDAGYNDARNNKAVPGDSAPGYKGLEVERKSGRHYADAINNWSEAASSAGLQFVQDSECKQGKCGYTTTGCVGACKLDHALGPAVTVILTPNAELGGT